MTTHGSVSDRELAPEMHALAYVPYACSESRGSRLFGGERTWCGSERLVDEIGISHKHLLREFQRCVCLTPKVLARVYSFQQVIESGWTEAGGELGGDRGEVRLLRSSASHPGVSRFQ